MSLILDALRKMERERKSRQSAAQELRSHVLHYRAQAAQPRHKPYLALSVGALLVLGGVAAGILVQGNRQADRGESASRPVQVAAANPAAAPAAPTQIVPAPAAAVQVAPAVPAATVPTARAVENAVAAPVARRPRNVPVEDAVASAPPVPVSSKKNPRIATAVPQRAAVPKVAAAPKVPALPDNRKRTAKNRTATTAIGRPEGHRETVQSGAADITVTGIAWQDERNLRRAVLNGNLVGEGSEVAGARVVEIRENRVRLSRGGQLFDVGLTSDFGR